MRGARKKGTSAELALQQSALPKKFTFPLKAQEKPFDLTPGDDHYKMLQNEFAAQYLQSIGADPTKINLDVVRRNLPLEQCNVTAVFKSRGWVDDNIFVAPKSPRTKAKETLISQHPFNAQDLFRMAVTNTRLSETTGPIPDNKKDRPSAVAVLPPLDFNNIKTKFVYPFNVQSVNEIRQAQLKKKLHSATVGEDFKPLYLSKDEYVDKEAMKTELSEPLKISVDQTKKLLIKFSKSFPFKDLGRRLSEEEISTLHELVSSNAMAGLIRHMCKLGYWCLMLDTMSSRPTTEFITNRQEGLFLCVFKEWEEMVRPLRKKKRGQLFFIPVCLLCLRAVCAEIFHSLYRTWMRSKEGKACTKRLDKMILGLFDPEDYCGLSILSSSAEAVRYLTRQSGLQTRGVKGKLYATSPVLRQMLGDPSSGKARAILNAQKVTSQGKGKKSIDRATFEEVWNEVNPEPLPNKTRLLLQRVVNGNDMKKPMDVSDDEVLSDEEEDEEEGEKADAAEEPPTQDAT